MIFLNNIRAISHILRGSFPGQAYIDAKAMLKFFKIMNIFGTVFANLKLASDLAGSFFHIRMKTGSHRP